MERIEEEEKERERMRSFPFLPPHIKSSSAWSLLMSRTLGDGLTPAAYNLMVKTASASCRSLDSKIFEL
ncbi:hypothetical protein TrRE_jg3, partial [Triparma retinervis]